MSQTLHLPLNLQSPSPKSRHFSALSRQKSLRQNLNRYDRADLVKAAFQELRFLQHQGANIIFEGGDWKEAPQGKSSLFRFTLIADFLIFGPQGTYMLVRLENAKSRNRMGVDWKNKLGNLGHGMEVLRCETPLDARQKIKLTLMKNRLLSNTQHIDSKSKAEEIFQ